MDEKKLKSNEIIKTSRKIVSDTARLIYDAKTNYMYIATSEAASDKIKLFIVVERKLFRERFQSLLNALIVRRGFFPIIRRPYNAF